MQHKKGWGHRQCQSTVQREVVVLCWAGSNLCSEGNPEMCAFIINFGWDRNMFPKLRKRVFVITAIWSFFSLLDVIYIENKLGYSIY